MGLIIRGAGSGGGPDRDSVLSNPVSDLDLRRGSGGDIKPLFAGDEGREEASAAPTIALAMSLAVMTARLSFECVCCDCDRLLIGRGVGRVSVIDMGADFDSLSAAAAALRSCLAPLGLPSEPACEDMSGDRSGTTSEIVLFNPRLGGGRAGFS